jgi:hypothetical protein
MISTVELDAMQSCRARQRPRVARGPEALAKALADSVIGAAGLDV